MKIVIVGFNQYQKKALLYREVEAKKIHENEMEQAQRNRTIEKAKEVFAKALEKGATIISTRVLEEK